MVLAAVNFAVLVPLTLLIVRPGPPAGNAQAPSESDSEPAPQPLTFRQALTSRPFLLLVGIYSVCGFQDFFVATHIVAFAQDQGVGDVLAGNLLAWMGVMGLLGVFVAGIMADALGASRPTVLCFVMRIGIFALIIPFQNTPVILIFGLLYGFTFLITAPLTVVFLGNIYGPHRLGTLTGTVSMIHQITGGLGALRGRLDLRHDGRLQRGIRTDAGSFHRRHRTHPGCARAAVPAARHPAGRGGVLSSFPAPKGLRPGCWDYWLPDIRWMGGLRVG